MYRKLAVVLTLAVALLTPALPAASAAPATGVLTASSAPATTAAPATMNTELRGSYAKTGRYLLFKKSVNPTLMVTVRPVQPGSCVRYSVDRLIKGHWRSQVLSGCFPLDRYSAGSAKMTGKRLKDRAYRMRAVLEANKHSSTTRSKWAYFKFPS